MRFQDLITFCVCIVFFVYNPVDAQVQNIQSLRIATINVWSGLTYQGTWKMGEYDTEQHRALRYQALVHYLREIDADVITIQEANPLPVYVRKLASDLGYQAYAHVGMGGVRFGWLGIPTNFREGEAILVRPGFQITNTFTMHTEELTQIIGIRLLIDGGPVNIFTTHLHAGPGPSSDMISILQQMLIQGEITREQMQEQLGRLEENEDRRVRELQAGLEYIRELIPEDEPTIFTGDFNLIPGSDSYQVLTDAGFEDSYQLQPDEQIFTWDAESNSNIRQYYPTPETGDSLSEKIYLHDIWQSQRLDYIWINSGEMGLNVIGTDIFGSESYQGVHPSDHFGFVTEIEFTPAAEDE